MNRKQILKNIHIISLIILVIAFFSILIKSMSVSGTYNSFNDNTIVEWNDGWVVNYDGKVVEDVSLPTEVPVERGGTVMLRKTLPDKIKEYNCLMLSGKRQDIEVSIGGIRRAEHSNNSNRLFGKTTPSGVILVPLYNTDSRTDITIHTTSDSAFSGQISSIYLGNEKSLIIMLIRKSIPSMICSAIVFILGIICFVCYSTYSSYFENVKLFHYLSLFAIISAVWSYSNLCIGQMFGNNLILMDVIGNACYMLIPISLILYINGLTEGRYRHVSFCFLVVGITNFIVQTGILVTINIGYFEMRYLDEAVFAMCVVGMIIVCILEARRKLDTETKVLILSTVALLLKAVIEQLPIVKMMASRGFNSFNGYIICALMFVVIGFFYITGQVSKEQRSRKDAESANRAKSLFLATMSHEIKTPINAVIGMNEMILRESNEANVREYANNISKAGEHLVALVNDVLDFSKIESGKMDIILVDYNVKSLLQDLILMTETRLSEKNLKLILDVDEDIPTTLCGDKIRIKQVVMNLLTNATKYTTLGSITFTVKCLSKDAESARLYFGVKDTGMGIKEEDISRLIDPFVRIDQVKNSSTEGTGLGLSITSQLLELMESKLEAESVYGEGSNFHFEISQKLIDASPMGSVREKVPVGKKKKSFTFTAPDVKILTVDDTKINNTVVKGILRPTKIQVESCESGKDCLELCRLNHYDIILMDHMMPEMDGIETLKKLREDNETKCSDTHVFVLTANTVAGSDEMYKACGFEYYLKKPVDVVELNKALLKYIQENMILPIEDEQ